MCGKGRGGSGAVAGTDLTNALETEDLCRTYGARSGSSMLPALTGWVRVKNRDRCPRGTRQGEEGGFRQKQFHSVIVSSLRSRSAAKARHARMSSSVR